MSTGDPIHHADLEIRILARRDDGYPVEITFSGERQFPRGHLDPALLPWVPGVSPEEDGERLFGLLFGDPRLRAAWNEARGESPARRLRLRIDPEAPELHAIPWEHLCEASPGEPRRHLAAAPETPFSRYLAGAWRARSEVLERPVRLLVAIANPEGLGERGLEPLDSDAERREIEEALSEVGSSELEVTFLEPPVTLPALEVALRRGAHLLHLVAHGRFSEGSGDTALYLSDDENRLALLRDEELAGMLGRQGEALRLVFLASCQSATRSPADAFRGLAPQLIAAGVPAVVAMQDLVPIETARTFSGVFYRQLLRHGLVDVAANEARSALLTGKLPGAAIPVLYMRLKNARLFGPRREEAAARRLPPRRLYWAVGAVILAVLVVLAIRPMRPAPTVEPPIVEAGSVVLDAVPWGEVTAIVDAEGRAVPLGEARYTPVVLSLPPGSYEVTVEHPGFPRRRSVKLEVRAAQAVTHSVEFAAADPDSYFEEAGLATQLEEAGS